MTPDLESMLSAVAKGDRDAFAHLYDAVSGDVYGVAMLRADDASAAEELTRRALVDVWERAATFDAGRADALAWILAITDEQARGGTAAADGNGGGLTTARTSGDAPSAAAIEPPPELRRQVLSELGVPETQSHREVSPTQFMIRVWGTVAVAVLIVAGVGMLFRQLADPFTRVAMAADATVIEVHGEGETVGEVAYSPHLHQVGIRLASLPGPPPDHTYQLWLLDETGATVPSIFLRPDQRGDVVEAVNAGSAGVSAVVVSLEPADGAASPGDQIVLVVTFDELGVEEDHA